MLTWPGTAVRVDEGGMLVHSRKRRYSLQHGNIVVIGIGRLLEKLILLANAI